MRKFFVYFGWICLGLFGKSLDASPAQKIPDSYWSVEYSRFTVDGHTYLHFTNPWYGRSDLIMHDPDCEKCDASVSLEDILEEVRSKCHSAADPHNLDVFFQEIRQSILTVQSKAEGEKEKKKKDKDKKNK